MASYLGADGGASDVGRTASLFAQQEMQSRPYYNGTPWFMGPMTMALSLQDGRWPVWG